MNLLYFIEIAHTDDFHSTGTRLGIDTNWLRVILIVFVSYIRVQQ